MARLSHLPMPFQEEIIDAAVEAARELGWCDEMNEALDYFFGHVHPRNKQTLDPHSELEHVWVHRDGRDYANRDLEGYYQDGYHWDTGRNRDGEHRVGERFHPAPQPAK